MLALKSAVSQRLSDFRTRQCCHPGEHKKKVQTSDPIRKGLAGRRFDFVAAAPFLADLPF